MTVKDLCGVFNGGVELINDSGLSVKLSNFLKGSNGIMSLQIERIYTDNGCISVEVDISNRMMQAIIEDAAEFEKRR